MQPGKHFAVFDGALTSKETSGTFAGWTRRVHAPLLDLLAISRARIATIYSDSAFVAPSRSVRKDADSGADVVVLHDDACARDSLFELLDAHSDMSGQFHAMSRDPWRCLFTHGRRAAMPFHSRPFALVAWRGPLGADDAHADSIAMFRRLAAKLGKHAVILGASDRTRERAAERGYGATWIGGEQFFDLARFTTRGHAGEKLRLAVNHARRVGLVASEIFPARDPAARARIRATELAWKQARPERGMTSFLRTAPMENAEHRRYFGAYTTVDARLDAFLVCTPVSARGKYLQDLVRHPCAPRGAGELVSLAALETFAKERLEFATMGIVPFFDPAHSRRTESLSPAAAWCIRRFDRVFRFSGLQRFRAKFPATEVKGVHALYWPAILTPMAVWDIAKVLG